MNTAALIMTIVAIVAAGAGLFVVTRPAKSEGAVYARRIAGTMLLALAMILGAFSYALWTWGPGK
jgi:hypothetical protein